MAEVQTMEVNDFVVKCSRKRRVKTHNEAKEVNACSKIEKERENGHSVNTSAVINPVLDTRNNIRKIPVPPHRLAALKENWLKITDLITEKLQLLIRFSHQTNNVEMKAKSEAGDNGNQQLVATAFLQAFIDGFEMEDAQALLREDDLFVESFELKDVRTLKWDHQTRAIGRLAGTGGRTKITIENATETRIVVADTKIHILGSFQNIQLARRAISRLIIGTPASKVFGDLKAAVSRMA